MTVIEGEPADAAHGLSIEEPDDPDDTEPHRRIDVGQQPADGIEALIFVWCGSSGDLHHRDGEGTAAAAALLGGVEKGP